MSVTTMRGLRVLVVEDSEDDTHLLVRQLVRGGYDASAVRVETAAEMSRVLDEHSWDLVIADYSLPRFSAFAALDLLRQKDLDIPFIILSGTIAEGTAVETMRAGAHDYIMKGNPARLLPAIERELREAEVRANRRRAEQAIRDNERRFRSLIEHASDITTVVGQDGTILYESPSIERLLGHVPGDLIGTKIQSHIHPEDIGRVLEALTTPANSGGLCVEFRFEDRRGGWRLLEATINHVVDNPDIGGVVLNCRDITARRKDEETIRHLAYYDPLTGLPNRILFNDRLTQALAHARRRGSRGIAVMFLDLDHFKTINDTLGHSAGDELLRSAAARLASSLREEDTVARLGGDEFLFLLPGVDDVEDATRIGQKIVNLFSTPFLVHEHELHVTTSVGISVFPIDGTSEEMMVRNADTALYRAKAAGRNRFQLYAPAMNALAVRRLTLENALRRAIERGELRLYYQPLLSLEKEELIGVEALTRWSHAELGPVPPLEFISLAEDTGLIIPLSRWVLRTACEQMKDWLRSGINLPTVSVNLSARRFNDSNLPEMVGEILQATGLDGRHLSIELTESVMMENAEETIHTLGELKKLGIQIAIDDFGTGYSSLSYLKRLPIDTLKIDQTFVRDIPSDTDDAAIAKLIIAMAHNLKLNVVAEGVETEEQVTFFRSRKCDAIQGFWLSKPLPAEELTPVFERYARTGGTSILPDH